MSEATCPFCGKGPQAHTGCAREALARIAELETNLNALRKPYKSRGEYIAELEADNKLLWSYRDALIERYQRAEAELAALKVRVCNATACERADCCPCPFFDMSRLGREGGGIGFSTKRDAEIALMTLAAEHLPIKWYRQWRHLLADLRARAEEGSTT